MKRLVYFHHHYLSRFKGNRLILLVLLQMALASLPVNKTTAQCGFFLADLPFPPSLSMCDLTIPAPLTIEHWYPEAHEFTVVITFDPSRYDLFDMDALTNVTFGVDGAGNTVVTGTFLAPYNSPDDGVPSTGILNLIFSRMSAWPGIDKKLSIVIFDAACGPDPVAEFHPHVTIFPDFADFRPYFQTSLLTLILLDVIDYCPAIGCNWYDHALIDEVDVDTDYAFDWTGTGKGQIGLLPGGRITVKTGHKLTLNNMEVFVCGTQLAQGITVEPGATLELFNCTISDCRFAVNAMPGSTIKIENTQFLNNYIGLNLDMTGVPEASKKVTIASLTGNTFATTKTFINAPYSGMPESVEARGYCGIKLTDYRDFNVWGGNTFQHLANGLLVRLSTFNIGNMFFDDMHGSNTAYPVEGFGIHLSGKGNRPYWGHVNELWHTMTFNNCKTGIFGFHYSAYVVNTVMTNVETGIDWSQSPTNDVRFQKNNISASKYGIRSFMNEPLFPNSRMDDNTIVITTAGGGTTPVTGIEMQESGIGASISNGWQVTNNDVTMNLGGRGVLYRHGIGGALDANTIIGLSQANNYTGIFTEGSYYVNVSRNTITQGGAGGLGNSEGILSSAGAANTFQCNCLDNTTVGTQFYDLADFTNAVRGNNFNTHVTGLQIGNGAVHSAFIGKQNHTGNLWDLASIPIGEFGAVNHCDLAKSPFFVPGAMGSNNQHPDVNPSPGWFFNTAGGSYVCANSCSFPPLMAIPPRVPETYVPTELDNAIANGTLSTNADVIWKGKYRLYRKMLRQPALQTYSPQMAAFKAANQNLPTGKLAYVSEERAKLFTLSSADQMTDVNYRNSIAQQTAVIQQMDSLRQAGNAINETQYGSLVQQKATNESNYAAFLQAKNDNRLLQIQNLMAFNTGTNTATLIEANHKMVNQIALNMLSHSLDEPLPSDLPVLSAIAAQCPISGGDAVYEARTMVERITGQTYNDGVLCATGVRMSQRDGDTATDAGSGIALFPNPTTGLLAWSGTEGKQVTIRVFDQLGALVKEQIIENQQVDFSLLPDGLYFVQMTDADGRVLAVQKVLLRKD